MIRVTENCLRFFFRIVIGTSLTKTSDNNTFKWTEFDWSKVCVVSSANRQTSWEHWLGRLLFIKQTVVWIPLLSHAFSPFYWQPNERQKNAHPEGRQIRDLNCANGNAQNGMEIRLVFFVVVVVASVKRHMTFTKFEKRRTNEKNTPKLTSNGRAICFHEFIYLVSLFIFFSVVQCATLYRVCAREKNADNFDIRILLIHHTEIKCFFIHFVFSIEFPGCFWWRS